MTDTMPAPAVSTPASASTDTIIAIGTRKGLLLASGDALGNWRLSGPHQLEREVAAVGFAPGEPRRVLIGTRSEFWGPSVMWSDDLGQTWQEREGSIAFPEETGAALARVWQLQPDPARPDTVWAGCEPTSLWRSDDRGESFELVRGLWDHPHRKDWQPGAGGAAVHTVLPDPADPDRLLIAMSTGGVYRSADGGASWTAQNTGIRVDFGPEKFPEFGQCVHKVAPGAAAGRFYAQNHGGVYRSDDDGVTWQAIDEGLPSDFGFPVLAHPHQPDVAWVAPLGEGRVPPAGRLRLYRTGDAGSTWQETGAGLPDSAWAAILRDAACVVDYGPDQPAGLVIGTRDGCVYASADEGESFTLVASHLADVLSVRAIAPRASSA